MPQLFQFLPLSRFAVNARRRSRARGRLASCLGLGYCWTRREFVIAFPVGRDVGLDVCHLPLFFVILLHGLLGV